MGHDKNFFLPCEKTLSSKLLRPVYRMDPWSCADKEGSKHHSQRCFAGLRGRHAPELPPGCGRGAAVKSVFMAARNGPRADCFPAAGEPWGPLERCLLYMLDSFPSALWGGVCPRRQAPLPPSRPPVLTDQCPHSELRLHCAHSRSAQAQG